MKDSNSIGDAVSFLKNEQTGTLCKIWCAGSGVGILCVVIGKSECCESCRDLNYTILLSDGRIRDMNLSNWLKNGCFAPIAYLPFTNTV